LKLALQVGAQLMPTGSLLTLPVPSPVVCTYSVTEAGVEELLIPPPQLARKTTKLKEPVTAKNLRPDIALRIPQLDSAQMLILQRLVALAPRRWSVADNLHGPVKIAPVG
jgi:hypothetical protein